MAWPKGKPRKAAIQEMNAQEQLQEPTLEFKKGEFYDAIQAIKSSDLVLAITHLRSDSKFPGLWELCLLNRDGTKKIVIDATDKASVIRQANLAIVRAN